MSDGDNYSLHHARNGQRRFSLPAGARQIILVRHGSSTGRTLETVGLGELMISNPPLTQDGHLQAEAVGTSLADAGISAIFATPLQRTQQTAAPLARALNIAPVIVEDLREVHLGEFEHSFYDHAASQHPLIVRMMVEERWDVIPDAETPDDFAQRVGRGLAHIVGDCAPGETVAVFSHAGTIGEICRQATGSRAFAFMAVENASVSRLIVNADNSWKLRSFNETSHL